MNLTFSPEADLGPVVPGFQLPSLKAIILSLL